MDTSLQVNPEPEASHGGAARIPVALNLALALTAPAGMLALLALASRAESWLGVLACGVVFSYLGLTNYAVLHEATHDLLHPDPRVNYGLGVVAGALFPVPYTLARITHLNHHARNRTDTEMFDLYYPGDNRLRKYVQWYGILLGFFWPFVPLGALAVALGNDRVRRLIIDGARVTGGYNMSEVRGRAVPWIRLETFLIISACVVLYRVFDLRPAAVAALYACFAFNWSTRQYVAHAFAPRHVVEGTWNLRHWPWMSWVLLNGEHNLTHHRRPDVPWTLLPRLASPDEPRPHYLAQYLRQWAGPRPCTEPEPAPLDPPRDTESTCKDAPAPEPREPLWAWPGWAHLRLALLVSLVTGAWFGVVYGGCDWITGLRGTHYRIHFDWEPNIPFVPLASVAYLSINLMLGSVAFTLRRRAELLAAGAMVLATTTIAGVAFLLYPSRLAYPPTPSAGVWQAAYDFADVINLNYNLAPSLHVGFAFAAGLAMSHRRPAFARFMFLAWASLIAVSTMLAHQHHLIDVITGAMLGFATYRGVYVPRLRRLESGSAA